MAIFERTHMPSLDGATGWLNSEPLGPAELRGHVVLVDFWTLTCINWLRTEPYIRAWSAAYRGDGLIVIGVHTPEFSFEHEIGLVRQAVNERAVDYPVAVDNDYAIWSAFDNNYWPALYFVDTDGILRAHHFGEGHYEQSERMIQRLLGVDRDLVYVQGTGVEAGADWNQLGTPERYVGYERSDQFASPGGAAFEEPRAYELPERLRLNTWALTGEWTIGRESAVLDRAGGSIAYRFQARDAHLVLYAEEGDPIPFRVLLDGEAPVPSHGVDVDEDGSGVLREGRLYQLVRQPGEVRDRTVEITFLEPGAEAFVFTFGCCCSENSRLLTTCFPERRRFSPAPDGRQARKTKQKRLHRVPFAAASVDDHEERLPFLDEVRCELGPVPTADVPHRVDRFGRDHQGLARADRPRRLAIDLVLQRALQDINDLFARMPVSDGRCLRADLHAVLDDLAPTNAQIVLLEIGALDSRQPLNRGAHLSLLGLVVVDVITIV